jgi:hypothetical protein
MTGSDSPPTANRHRLPIEPSSSLVPPLPELPAGLTWEDEVQPGWTREGWAFYLRRLSRLSATVNPLASRWLRDQAIACERGEDARMRAISTALPIPDRRRGKTKKRRGRDDAQARVG